MKHETSEWILLDELVYFSLLFGSLKIPKGFVTDLASVPRLFRSLFPAHGSHSPAAIVHDYLYQMKGKIPSKNLTRKQCDQVFLEAMKILNVPFWKRHLMYRAVRLGGWTHWNF